MKKFREDGRLIIPLLEKKALNDKEKEKKVRYVLTEAYCPKGCNIIDHETKINDYAGLRIKFSREGMKGEFVISAIEGDFEKIMLSGELKDGVKDELYCPHCKTKFKKLVNCNCSDEAELVVVGLTPKLDLNNAITFCNVTGCKNGSFVKAGHALRHIRLSVY